MNSITTLLIFRISESSLSGSRSSDDAFGFNFINALSLLMELTAFLTARHFDPFRRNIGLIASWLYERARPD
jgi:hypothetical protein